MTVRICLAGHRQLFLAGLARILGESPFAITAEAGSIAEARQAGDVSLIVVDKPEALEGVEDDLMEIGRLAPRPKIVVIADAFDEDEMVFAFGAGVDGYLLANISPEALRESLSLVMLGEYVFPSKLVTALCGRARHSRLSNGASADAALSEREAAIVARLAEGMPNKVIATELTIAEATVKVHLKSILKKLGVANRTQAAVWAINNGITVGSQAAGH
jgi:two-component system nitrate/nitrite response regulator NarL